jgi:hypothetical protein
MGSNAAVKQDTPEQTPAQVLDARGDPVHFLSFS